MNCTGQTSTHARSFTSMQASVMMARPATDQLLMFVVLTQRQRAKALRSRRPGPPMMLSLTSLHSQEPMNTHSTMRVGPAWGGRCPARDLAVGGDHGGVDGLPRVWDAGRWSRSAASTEPLSQPIRGLL